MLRDKLAESETKQLEDCIAEHVLRESLFEHVKARLDAPVSCCVLKLLSTHLNVYT